MIIQLIQPAKSEGYVSNSRTGCYVPLGLISIATYCRQQIPGAHVEILDGELMANREIAERIQPGSIVGIDTKTPNYASALELAREAKDKGCKVVVGGVYASALPNEIYHRRRGIIDHIVVGFGEKPFVDIANGKEDRIICNPEPSFDDLPVPDRSLVDLEQYIMNFRQNHSTWDYRGTNIFTHMGCDHACLFCSRSGPEKTIYRNPLAVWQEVRTLVEEHGIGYIVDFSDAVTQDMPALSRLAGSKPDGLNPIFHVFSTAEGINKETVELFKKLNVRHVFIGAETGDYGLAKTIAKGSDFTPGKVLEAIVLLAEAGIGITPSFVLGLPGEDACSLERTYEFAREIKSLSGFEEIFCSALIPFPGSRAFDLLKTKCGLDTDMLDAEELKRLWIDSFCNVDYKTIGAYSDKILSLGRYTITINKI